MIYRTTDLPNGAVGPYADDIARTLELLFIVTSAEVLEVRRVTPRPASCWLTRDDIPRVSKLVADTDDADVEATYVTLNPVKPDLLPRSHARFKQVGKGKATSDTDIRSRHLLLVDFDPVRKPRKQSSTDAEKAAALERARDCRHWVTTRRGWFPPILADSGNGYHLLFCLPGLPIDETTDRHISSCLKMIHHHFSDDVVEVDTSVSNPARITKLYSTWTRKGTPTFERPWRRSCLLEIPDEVLP